MTSCQFPVRLQPSLGGTVSAEARRVMGDLQHFCLRWNNYQNSITTAFENLRDDEDFIDVTLACDGKSLKAHRVVLSACSPYFRELLKSTPCKHPVIVLQDVVFDDLQALVEFIYHGEVNVHQRNLSSFLKTAEVLRVSGLTQPSDSASNDHSARQSSETPPAENSFLSLAAQAVEGRVSPQVRQRKGFPQQSPSSIPSPRSKENSPIPLNKRNNKTLSGGSNGGGGGGNGGGGGGGGGGMDLSERTSQHSPGSAGSRPNCMDDEDSGERSDGGSGGGGGGGGGGGNGNGLNMMHDEPPMDYSRTHQLHAVAAVLHQQQQQQQQQQDTAQNLMVPRRSSPAEVKSEPMDTASSAAPLNNSGGGGAYGADDCSNDSAADFTGVHPAVGMSEPDDTSYQSHHSYLDSKFFAAAGAATFNFSMAAAMAADSLAGLNNHNHTNVMEALGGSSSQDWSEAGGGVGVGGAETLSCFVCGKRLSTRLTLKRHIEQQHNQPLHSAVCNVCNKVFRTLNSLNNHKSIYHRKPKAYKSTAGGGTVVASAAAAAVAAAGLVPPASSPDGTGDGSAAATAPKNLPPLTVWYKNNNNNHNNNNNGNGN